MVRRGEVSLGLRYFGDPSPELVCRQISEERIVVVCSAHHQWGGKRLRDPGQLRADQWFSLPMTRHRDSFAHLVTRQLASVGLGDVPVMTIDSLTAQKRLIEAGIGIALLPESSVHEELRLGTFAYHRCFTSADDRSYLRALSQVRVFDRCLAYTPFSYQQCSGSSDQSSRSEEKIILAAVSSFTVYLVGTLLLW